MICVEDNALGGQVEQVDRCYRARHDYSQTTTDTIVIALVYFTRVTALTRLCHAPRQYTL